jgi:hypothetical protein
MRIFAIMALTLTLVGGAGDRLQRSMNSPQGYLAMSHSPQPVKG